MILIGYLLHPIKLKNTSQIHIIYISNPEFFLPAYILKPTSEASISKYFRPMMQIYNFKKESSNGQLTAVTFLYLSLFCKKIQL
jgi:hypothetical protein